MRTLIATLALVAAAAPLAAQHNHGHAGAPDPRGGLPAGWHVRLDRADASLAGVSFAPMGGGFHATTGPAVILWRAADTGTGEYRATATFAQTRAPAHPEAYGLFIGGKELETAQQDYMYFLVRGDGKYLIKHRAGDAETHTIVDWTEHAAVNKQDAQGRASNTLTVEAGEFGVRFLANGTQVAEFLRRDVPYLSTDGIVGLRVNHNLDVHVSGFAVEKR
ncbi:MAG TPA: hypothetical protein VFX98_11795 [Longimicrobiaceae bacterium]|nr:hypothetical protein [Longimicrobiaceae bacterium]